MGWRPRTTPIHRLLKRKKKGLSALCPLPLGSGILKSCHWVPAFDAWVWNGLCGMLPLQCSKRLGPGFFDQHRAARQPGTSRPCLLEAGSVYIHTYLVLINVGAGQKGWPRPTLALLSACPFPSSLPSDLKLPLLSSWSHSSLWVSLFHVVFPLPCFFFFVFANCWDECLLFFLGGSCCWTKELPGKDKTRAI